MECTRSQGRGFVTKALQTRPRFTSLEHFLGTGNTSKTFFSMVKCQCAFPKAARCHSEYKTAISDLLQLESDNSDTGKKGFILNKCMWNLNTVIANTKKWYSDNFYWSYFSNSIQAWINSCHLIIISMVFLILSFLLQF